MRRYGKCGLSALCIEEYITLKVGRDANSMFATLRKIPTSPKNIVITRIYSK